MSRAEQFFATFVMIGVLCGAVCIGGCSLSPATIATLTQGGCELAASQAVRPNGLTVATATKVLTALEAAKPIVNQLQTSNDLRAVLLPALTVQIDKVLADPAQASLALDLIGVGMDVAKGYLDKNAKYNTDKAVVAEIANGAIDGLVIGLQRKIAATPGTVTP